MGLHRFKEALDALKIAEKDNHNYGEILLIDICNNLKYNLWLATSLIELKRSNDALQYSEKAIKFNEECATAYNNKGNINFY